MHRRITPGRIALAAATGLLPVAVSAGYQSYATRRDRRRFPAPGELVEVGDGHRLHVLRDGLAHDGPAVLLEAGMSCPHDVWEWVRRDLARVAPVLAYDRAGLGCSEPGPVPRTARRLTGELVDLLEAIGCTDRLVLVGHSFGGLLVRHFAHLHPDRVAGVVLVDSAHPEELERSPRQRLGLPIMVAQMRSTVRSAAFGVMRYGNTYVGSGMIHLPADVLDAARARMMTAKTWRAAYAEMIGWLESVNAETRDTKLPAGVPLAVLTAGQSQSRDPDHGVFQRELAELSDNSVHRVIPDAEHLELVMREDQHGHVTRAILDVLAAARTGQPLTDGADHG